MLRNLPFRSRLMLVVSLPLIVVLGFAGFTIKDRFDALGAEQQYGELIGPFETLTRVARAVGDEGVTSEWYIRAPESADTPLAASLTRTNNALEDFQQMSADLPGGISDATRKAIRDLSAQIKEIYDVRAEVVDAQTDANTTTYADIGVEALNTASSLVRDVENRTLATSLSAVLDLRREQLAVAEEGALVTSHLNGGSPDIDDWVRSITEQKAQRRLFGESANEIEFAAFTAIGIDDIAGDLVRDEAGLALPRSFEGLDTTPDSYAAWYADKQTALDNGVGAVQTVINREANDRESRARGVLIVVALGTAALIWSALMLVWALVRSVSGSLRALTRGARELSERRLPMLVDTLRRGGDVGADGIGDFTPIRVDSKDELGDLAKAFNTTQEVTITVAREQSDFLKKGIGDLYVNLARRNQSLLDRQISLLDDLESSADPDELASLFELDHLATRMRRNAESLLVLSGAEQPRHWGTSVPIVDVVRASAAEIADFARLHAFGFDDDIAITGNAVADITHLLAELLENATAFSPPDTPVTVGGRMLEKRFVISVTDEGIGMDDERLASANALLARPPAPGLALSRTLGLHVVAHLAARHGIHVQLRRAEPTGVAALVVLPSALLTVAPPDGGEPEAPRDAAPAPDAPLEARVRAEVVTDESTVAPPAPEPAHESPSFEPAPATAYEPPPAYEPPAPVHQAPPAPAHEEPPAPIFYEAPAPAPEPMPEPMHEAPPELAPFSAMSDPSVDEFPRRVPSGTSTWDDLGNGDGGNGHGAPEATTAAGNGNGLTARVPGANLSHRPEDQPPAAQDVRPRPERVHDLLSRHSRGKRDGRDKGSE